jgi:hypothetical protein
MKRGIFTVILLLTAIAAPTPGKNVDLVTLPKRDSVQLTIYNSEDITLVKETRYITLKKGANKLQFSWAGTLIDPTSVEFRPLEHENEIEVADTIFPGQKPQHLIWNIESKFEGQVKVEVTYFTSGLFWSMDYVATCDPGETVMKFRGYVQIFNNSGEEYDNAQIRLIVGKINLVEKIADLARRRGIAMPKPGTIGYSRLKQGAASTSICKAEAARDSDGKGRKAIVKEGLSEYFMFTVKGAETIRNNWSKRMQAVQADNVKFDIVYRMRSYQYGPRPVRFFVWRNDSEHGLGDCPLPNGRVRVLRENGMDGLSYLGEKIIRYVPIKAEIEVNLGPDDLVVYETRRGSTERFNFHFDIHNRVCGWDEKTMWVDTIRNYRTKPITFELRRQWTGDVDYVSEIKTTLFDYRTTDIKLALGALSKKLYPCTVVCHMGSNKKQSRINLKKR